MTKKAIQLVKYGKGKDTFQTVEITQQSPSNDEVQIEVERFGLNYADVMARNGLYGEAPPLPCVLGYEVVGKVIAVGNDVPQDLLEKRVVAFTQFGGYSEIVNTKYYGVAPIGNYDGNKALCLATQYVTAYYMCNIATSIFEDENVLIHAAAGGVGTALIQLLKAKGVVVYAKTSREEKEEYLKNLGADYTINYSKSEYSGQVKALLKDKKLDVVFNPVGGSTFKKDWKMLGKGGRLFLYGGSEMTKKWGILSQLNFLRKMGLILPVSTLMQSKSLIGINMLSVAILKPRVLQQCLQDVVKMALENKITPHVGRVFPADALVEAHDFLASGKSTGKIAVEW